MLSPSAVACIGVQADLQRDELLYLLLDLTTVDLTRLQLDLSLDLTTVDLSRLD